MSQEILQEVLNYAPLSGSLLRTLTALAEQADDTGKSIVTWEWLERREQRSRETIMHDLWSLETIMGMVSWRIGLKPQFLEREQPFEIQIFLPIERIRGYVYLIRSGLEYKIGHTNDTYKRIPTLSLQLAYRPVVIHTIATSNPHELEDALHARYADKRMNGEWFALNDEDIANFCDIRDVFANIELYRYRD